MYKYFDFKCGECDHEFERMVKDDSLPKHCPECGAEKVVKVPSRAGTLKFKGTKATSTMRIEG